MNGFRLHFPANLHPFYLTGVGVFSDRLRIAYLRAAATSCANTLTSARCARGAERSPGVRRQRNGAGRWERGEQPQGTRERGAQPWQRKPSGGGPAASSASAPRPVECRSAPGEAERSARSARSARAHRVLFILAEMSMYIFYMCHI